MLVHQAARAVELVAGRLPPAAPAAEGRAPRRPGSAARAELAPSPGRTLAPYRRAPSRAAKPAAPRRRRGYDHDDDAAVSSHACLLLVWACGRLRRRGASRPPLPPPPPPPPAAEPGRRSPSSTSRVPPGDPGLPAGPGQRAPDPGEQRRRRAGALVPGQASGGRFLFAVNEVDEGRVLAFAINQTTGALTRLNDQPSAGVGPAHLSVDRAGRFVLVANYADEARHRRRPAHRPRRPAGPAGGSPRLRRATMPHLITADPEQPLRVRARARAAPTSPAALRRRRGPAAAQPARPGRRRRRRPARGTWTFIPAAASPT